MSRFGKSGKLLRCYVVEHKGGNKAVWECSEGHRWTGALMKLKKFQRIGEAGFKLMASWWSKEKGGATMPCPKCAKKEPK